MGWCGRWGTPSAPLAPQKEYFQDDIYLPTRVWWEPALGGSSWLAGQDGQQRRASLRPADMTPGGCSVRVRTAGPRGQVGCASAVGRSSPAPRRCDAALPVSEAPKEAPARKFVPASVYLEEKSDEQKKEEVGAGAARSGGAWAGGAAPHPTALPCLPAAAERHGGPAGQPGRPAAAGLLRGGGRGRVGTCRGWGGPRTGADPPRPSPHRASRRIRPDPGTPRTAPGTPRPPGPAGRTRRRRRGRAGGGGGGGAAGPRAAPGQAEQRR